MASFASKTPESLAASHNKEMDSRTMMQKALTHIVQQGPIPQHIAFIMDGNRRFARERNLKPVEGHKLGSTKLQDILNWCWRLGIKEATLYAFSIENYKRSEDEVKGLISLFREVIEKCLLEIDHAMENGLCIQCVGDWNLIPEDLRPMLAKAMIQTRYNTNVRINVAISYTGRNEISNGVKRLQYGVQNGDISLDDISEDLLQESLQLIPSRPLDLLVRTSGETRLSDFMLWESSFSSIAFLDRLWPELTYWDILKVVAEYQFQNKFVQKQPIRKNSTIEEERKQNFIKKIRKNQWQLLELEANTLNSVE